MKIFKELNQLDSVTNLLKGTSLVDQKLVARPANGGTVTVRFDPLPVGTFTVTSTAFPNADGTGTAQATASIPLILQAGQNTDFTLTMGSTIDHLELSVPDPIILVRGRH